MSARRASRTTVASPDAQPKYTAPPGSVKANTIATRSAQVATYTTLVTPEIAATWLSHNTHNRTLRNAGVANLTGVIERGEWRMNGDGIRFDTGGTLIDGQHRLWAVTETDIAVPSLVIVGLPPETQETMDTGGAGRRSLADALKLRGITGATVMASVLTYWWRYQTGNVRYASIKPSISQSIALLDEHPELRTAAQDVSYRFVKRFRGSVGMMACALYEFRTIDPEQADYFYDHLISGEGLEAHDPILVLRRHFEQQTIAGTATRSTTLTSHALTIKAWNYWRDGRQIDRLSWKAAGLKAEPFPEPH